MSRGLKSGIVVDRTENSERRRKKEELCLVSIFMKRITVCSLFMKRKFCSELMKIKYLLNIYQEDKMFAQNL